MKRALLVLTLLLAACSSSSKASEPPATTAATTTTTVPADCTPARPAPEPQKVYNAAGREYTLALPDDYDSTRAIPIVFNFHGHGANKELFEIDTKMGEIGAQRGYAVVIVDGKGAQKTWTFLADTSIPGNDYEQVLVLVAELTEQLCVDDKRVFAVGHSAGSAFAGFLVCREPYPFAGVANVAATIPSTCGDGARAAVIGIHGIKDPAVLYDGGLGAGQQTAIPPFKQTLAQLAERNGCNATPVSDEPGEGVERVSYEECAAGLPVAGISIVDGGHPWPGGFQAMATEPVVPGARYSATEAILDFFDAVGEQRGK